MKQKTCKICKKKFGPVRPLQSVCSVKCALEYQKQQGEKRAKKQRLEMKKSLLTRTDYLNILQATFNNFIRQRDKNQPCISCRRPLGINYHAGHYFPTSVYPNLRFNELNVHGQCIRCNMHLHGNIAEYLVELPKRIGQKKVDKLYADRDKPLKLTLEEIKDLIKVYKDKLK
jgi:hypothetical protein